MAETSNTMHSARVDDVLAAEIDAEEDLELPAAAPSTPLPGPLNEAERRHRSELAIALRPGVFPADRGLLLQVAKSGDANAGIVELLERLPIDTRFDTVQDVWEAAGGHRELRDGPAAPERDVEAGAPVRPGAPDRARAGVVTVALGAVATGVVIAFDVARTVTRGVWRLVPVHRLGGRRHG